MLGYTSLLKDIDQACSREYYKAMNMNKVFCLTLVKANQEASFKKFFFIADMEYNHKRVDSTKVYRVKQCRDRETRE